uniref:WGS project CBMI000000000 data, contig CS3069_c001298 n=1 Tax=Fusarium clavum TaxID=2594811 RepID=A0A090N5G7_9HYPO|nr:unnamed protein product [Fusarium clavum]
MGLSGTQRRRNNKFLTEQTSGSSILIPCTWPNLKVGFNYEEPEDDARELNISLSTLADELQNGLWLLVVELVGPDLQDPLITLAALITTMVLVPLD